MNKLALPSFLVLLFCSSLFVSGTVSAHGLQKSTDDAPTLADTTHIRFLDIHINGTPTQFCDALKRRGFKLIENEPDAIHLRGRFAGNNDCALIVYFSPELNIVTTVEVSFPTSYLEYNRIARQLNEKYKLYKSDLNTSHNTYFLPEGIVTISYIHTANETMVMYIDTQNYEKAEDRKSIDL